MPEQFIPQVGFVNLPVPPAWKAEEQLNSYQSWVYACTNAIAQEIASTEFKLYKKKYVRGELEIAEVTEHEALSLLYEVNPYSNEYMHIYETAIYLMLLGEAYWAIMRNGSKPVSLWTLRPDFVTIVPSSEKLIDHYVYRVAQGKEINLPYTDVVPFRFPNPKAPYRGKSPVQSAARAIDTDTFSANWNRNFFFNSALPNLVFTTDQVLKEEQVKRLLAEWSSKFQGTENAHKVAFMTAGFTPTEIGQKMKDMDFIEQRRAMRDEIMSIFKVPKTVLGLTEDVNRANAEATKAAFIEGTIAPLLRMFVSHLNEFYLINWPNENLFFDFEDPSPEDTTTKLALYKNALGGDNNVPWMTINEVRELENLEPVEGGDVIYLSFGLKAMGEESPELPFNSGEPKGLLGFLKRSPKVIKLKAERKTRKKKFNVQVPPKGLNQLRREQLNDGIKKDLIRIVSLAMKLDEPDDKKRVKENFWKQMVAQTDVLEQKMVEMLDSVFSRQKKEVLTNIEEAKGINLYGRKAAVDSLLFDKEKYELEMRKDFGRFIEDIIEQRALEVFNFMGVGGTRFNTHTTNVMDFLRTDGLKFITGINDTTRERLRDSLLMGLEQGEAISSLKDRVQRVFLSATESRAEMIARTEVLRSTNFATQEAYKQSNVVVEKEWLTALDPCPECEPMDGKIVPLNGLFVSPMGSVEYPPLHPRCRCTTIPVLKEKSVPVNVKELKKEQLRNKLNEEIESKAKTLEKIMDSIEQLKNEEKESLKLAEGIRAEADEKRQEILLTAEKEKEQLLKDLKSLRNKVKEAINGRK